MLRWYAVLAILSRGATTLGLLAVSFLVDQEEYGLIGLAFVAITTASQVFGYPGYLTALNSNHAKQSPKNRQLHLAIALALAAFVYVIVSFWFQLGGENVLLLVASALAAAALTASATLNGMLQKLKYERFAAQNTGAFLVPAIAIGVMSSPWLGFASIVMAIFLAHLMALATALRYARAAGLELASLSLKYTDYALFALSGLAASLLLVLAANLLFSRGGAVEMGQLTLALQIRAILIFGAGVLGAEMLSRYSSTIKSEGGLGLKNILSDLLLIFKWLCVPVFVAILASLVIDIEAYQPLFNRSAVCLMLASGVFICATIPFSRALTAQYSEYWNVGCAVASSVMCGAGLFIVSGDAESFALIFSLNSLVTLILTVVTFARLFRSRDQ